MINKALSELIIESKHNYIRSISDITQISAQPTDTYLECEGAASLSQALGKNKALTKLSLAGEAKRNTIVIYAGPDQFSSVLNKQATELGLWE